VTSVPNAALRWHPTGAKSDGRQVYVLDRSVPNAIPVRLGVTNGSFTEVISGLDLNRREVVIGTDSHADRN
jgi:hypothetical protein